MKKSLIIGERYRSILEAPLAELGYGVLWLPDNPSVSRALSGHADLSVFLSPFEGEKTAYIAQYLRGTYFSEELALSGYDVRVIPEIQSPVYPGDVHLNIRAAGGSVLLNSRTVSRDLYGYLSCRDDIRLIDVHQGYAACCTLCCGEDAIITSDPGIYRAVSEAGFDVLKISPGHILLPGYDYGFIGGCAFMPCAGVMAFTGSLDTHPDRISILDFLSRHSVAPVFLTEHEIFDIGGALIFERI